MTGNKMPSIAAMYLPLLLLLLALTAVTDVAVAETRPGCSNLVLTLSPCLTYLTGDVAEPSQACCTSLANVVKINVTCLCQLATGTPNGLPVNTTLALAIPVACKVSTPPIGICKGSGVATPPVTLPPVPNPRPTPDTGSGNGTNSTDSGSKPAEVSSAGIFLPTAISLFFTGLIFSAILL